MRSANAAAAGAMRASADLTRAAISSGDAGQQEPLVDAQLDRPPPRAVARAPDNDRHRPRSRPIDDVAQRIRIFGRGHDDADVRNLVYRRRQLAVWANDHSPRVEEPDRFANGCVVAVGEKDRFAHAVIE